MGNDTDDRQAPAPTPAPDPGEAGVSRDGPRGDWQSHGQEQRAAADAEPVAYWNVNLPRSEWTERCPEYLAEVDELDRAQLGRRDADYEILSWPEVKRTIAENRLQDFKRIPSDLHRYRKFMAQCRASHGSVMNYMLKERLGWRDLTPAGKQPFANEQDDIRILRNDWPYGIDRRIVHLCVWTKFDFEEDPATGDLTGKARREIDDYVTRVFRQDENPQHIAWFKNWTALKSIHAVEHFHVMIFDPDPDFIRRVTSGDVALFMKKDRVEKHDTETD